MHYDITCMPVHLFLLLILYMYLQDIFLQNIVFDILIKGFKGIQQ